MDLPYKTTFAAQVRAIQPSETEIKEAKASIANLRAMLPPGIDPEADAQLLYVAANLYVAGMVNLNDDGVDIETSLAGYKGFERQQLNIEHDRKRIAGYILHAGLSEFGTDRLITPDEARAAGEPFNVCVVAALWRVANPQLCDFLEEASNPIHPDYKALSLSFEVGYSSYNVAVIDPKDRVIAQAKRVVRPEDSDFEVMSKRLRSYGGSGKDGDDGIYQILTGSFMPLGGGIVAAPAAAVKGITTITEAFEAQPHEEDENPVEDDKGRMKEESLRAAEQEQQDYADLRARISGLVTCLENSSLSRIILPQTRVSPITSQSIPYMKSLKEIQEKAASVQSLDEAKQIVASIVEIAEALSKASEKMSDDLEAEKNRGAEIERNRAAAQAASEDLKKQLDAVASEMKDIKDAQVAAQAQADFDERMAQIEETFELNDEDRTFVVEEVKDLDKTAFAKWLDKNVKSVRREKTKAHRAEVAAATKKPDVKELLASLKDNDVEMENAVTLIKEALASAKANNVSTGITNTIDATKSLAAQVQEEFAENVSIGGKKISEYKRKE